ncbi:hypothetical protein Poli38472_013880 [Pythium oligandrum]|uniref:Glutamine amidotransferase domain-containing protein n=1 Tax=Pythium oligandrum TaxID=41045 RepID=A0A8K1C2E0_PYTOL|nr:hypothetical protein Poli38472_013880 [Pythium oligandrum]|eukprot:TMW55118.1 hypothetical protein Poli38472_013880 [Pythium oligandrum]
MRVLARAASLLRAPRHRGYATATPKDPVRYLVIDGYIKWGRDDLESGGATTAGQLYADMMIKCTPKDVPAVYDLIYTSDPGFEPPDLSKYHALAWSGSSLTVYKTEDERIHQSMVLARRAYELGIPQFGSCFGAQIAAATAGGRVAKNPMGKEVGIGRKIHLTEAGRAHPLYEGKPSVFGGFSSHNDHITHIQPGGLWLAKNTHTPVQAVAIRHLNGDFWALQYHPEYDLHEFARLLYCRRKVSIELGFFRDMASADKMIDDLEALHSDHSRQDLAWLYGIDHDVLDDNIRTIEVQNFIKHLVLPYKGRQQKN